MIFGERHYPIFSQIKTIKIMQEFDILHNAKCCVCSASMMTSKHLNIVAVNISPLWRFPIMQNIRDATRKAVSVLCDTCVESQYTRDNEIKYVVEIRGEEIIYHNIETLKNDINTASNN